MVARRRKNLSPRYLTFRHARCLLRSKGLLKVDDDWVAPGEVQLHSYVTPGLQGGTYNVSTKQDISANGRDKPLTSEQDFYVDKPLFALPEGEIHTVYPPQGHAEWAEALPHVIFNHPTTPWEWRSSDITQGVPDYENNRNRVPWLAVLVFTKDELELSNDDLDASKGIFRDIQGMNDPAQPVRQTATLSVPMRVSEIKNVADTVTPINQEVPDDAVTTEAIFLRERLFTALFTKLDDNGKPSPNEPFDVRQYRYLAHRRTINTQGMAVAALTATEDDQTSLSVVFSHRTGPTATTEPTLCIAHLVSIRGIETMKGNDPEAWPSSGTRFVAMSSLHSWSYSSYPTTMPNIKEQFEALAASCTMLCPSITAADMGESNKLTPVQQRVLTRLQNGYMMARYRVRTGEATACFTRGAFIPVLNNADENTWKQLSNLGSDLQVLDQQLGIMDITYSAAWQLGRTMAIADPAFVSSLGQIRRNIYDRAMYKAQLDVTAGRTRSEVLSALPSLVGSLKQLSYSKQLSSTSSRSRRGRWHRPSVEPTDLSYPGRAMGIRGLGKLPIEDYFRQAAFEVSAAYDNQDPENPSNTPYNEFNTPFSADWQIVLKWVLDRLVFSNIPIQYLVTDSSHLPEESIRFFEVDTRWMNAMIDGALSLANYIDQEDDRVRAAIYEAINRYRFTDIPQIESKPPLPIYGFLIRSALITKFPDVKLEVLKGTQPVSDLILLRHDIVNNDTMLCLLSQRPSSSSWDTIWLTQPPHQETFIAGSILKNEYIQERFRKAYTSKDYGDTDPTEAISEPEWKRDDDSKGVIYHWTDPSASFEVRRLSMEFYANAYLTSVQDAMGDLFQDDTATSALMGTQMNSFVYRLRLNIDQTQPEATVMRLDPSAIRTQPVVPPYIRPPATPVSTDDRPSFQFKVRSTDNSTSRSITMTETAQDLIFNLILKGTPASYKFEWVEITIPLGTPDPTNPCLMQFYTGPGAYMLSNVRFNPLVTITQKDGVPTDLVITLKPRSSEAEGVTASNCSELTFILSEVFINKFDKAIEVPTREWIWEKLSTQGKMRPIPPPESILLTTPKSSRKTMKEARAAFLQSASLQ
ncbi:hypothetical protein BDV25DRAFT_160965 [Aspergillus avenaceus]|uniref:Uncharacterized protein n=1 Tax=Aspergillus avenaceus TaxID=36643 RepID=A0A5N6TLD8_ASPAV|nr:hypothetical protein BDV25DRAFT_160965 [Aspergillus avenaceus]